jgi:hypothetical protein
MILKLNPVNDSIIVSDRLDLSIKMGEDDCVFFIIS